MSPAESALRAMLDSADVQAEIDAAGWMVNDLIETTLRDWERARTSDDCRDVAEGFRQWAVADPLAETPSWNDAAEDAYQAMLEEIDATDFDGDYGVTDRDFLNNDAPSRSARHIHYKLYGREAF